MADNPSSRKLSEKIGLALGAQGKAIWEPLRPVLADYCLARTSVEIFFKDELELENDRILCCVPEEYEILRASSTKNSLPEPPAPGEYLLWADNLPKGFMGLLCASEVVGARTALARFADSLIFPGSMSQHYIRVPDQEVRGLSRPLVFIIDWLDTYEAFTGWTKEDWRLFLYTKLQEGADELILKPFNFPEWDTGAPLLGLEPSSASECVQWKSHAQKLDDLFEIAGELALPLGFRLDPQLAFPLALPPSMARPRADVACLANPAERKAALASWQASLVKWVSLSTLLFAPGLGPHCQCEECASNWLRYGLDLSGELIEAFGGLPGVSLALTVEGLGREEQNYVYKLILEGRLAWCKRLLVPYTWAMPQALLEQLAEKVEVITSVDTSDPTGHQLAAPPLLGEFLASMPPSASAPRPEACARLEERVKLTGRVALRSSRVGEQFNQFALGRALKWAEFSTTELASSFCNLHLTKFDTNSFRKKVIDVERVAVGLDPPSGLHEIEADSLKTDLLKTSSAYEVVSWQGSLLLWTVAGVLKTSAGLHEMREELAALAHRLATATVPEQGRTLDSAYDELHKLARRKSLLGSERLKSLLPFGSIRKLSFDLFATGLNRDSLGLAQLAEEARAMESKAGSAEAIILLVSRLRALAGISPGVVPGGLAGGVSVEGGTPLLLPTPAIPVAAPLFNCTASAWGQPVRCRLSATKGRSCRIEITLPWDGRQPALNLSADGALLAEVRLAPDRPTWRQFEVTPQSRELLIEFAPVEAVYCPCFCSISLLSD